MRRNNMKPQGRTPAFSLVMIAMTWLTLTGAAQAAGKYVTVAGGGNGSSFQNAMTLTAALAAGNATTPIYIQAGTYHITAEITLSTDVKIYGGFAGTETVPFDRTGEPGVDHVTILNGQSQRRIMTVGNCEVLLDRLTFENGNAIGANGGALYFEVYQGNPTSLITDCTFKNNIASAPLLDDDAPAPFISNGGGAAYIAGNNGPTFIGCDFLNNEATFGHGGAIHWNNTSPDFSIDCHFEGNKAGGNGGAISQHGWGNLQVLSCSFVNNFAAGKGGAIGSTDFPQWHTHAENCVFLKNTATIDGGALFSNTVKSMRLIHNTFHGNSTTHGTTDGVLVLLMNNTNEFREDGSDRKYQPVLVNNLFSGHLKVAADIAHMDDSDPGPSEFNSNIFVGGIADGGANGYVIRQHGDNIFPPLNMLLLPGSAAEYYVSVNPQTAADLALGSGSPAIDQGLADSTALAWFKEDTLSLYTDILETDRIDGQPDVGAYEFQKTVAHNESPRDNTNDVAVDVILEWSPGLSAITHNVYVGESFEEVEAATVPTRMGLDVNSFDLGRLEFGDTVFWRVDEVSGTPDQTVFPGKVWSFKVEPYSIKLPSEMITATASSHQNDTTDPGRTIDGSGLDDPDSKSAKHSNAIADVMWMSVTGDPSPWLMYEFDDVQILDQLLIWNSNHAFEASVGWGIKDVDIQVSIDGVDWTSMPDVSPLTRATGYVPSQAQVIDMGLVQAKYVKLNILNNWGGATPQYAVAEVQFYSLPLQARTPVPASGSTGILPNAVVSWHAGRKADQSIVYVSTDPNEVAAGTAPSTTVNANRFNLDTLDIQMGETYYWRVDEVNNAEAGSVWAGPVWNLTIIEAFVIDDFEGYNNISPDRPFQTWLDGFGYSVDEFFPASYSGNGTGAGIGHDIWSLGSPHYDGDIMDKSVTVPGSGQSMPFYYSNSGGVASETQRTFAVPQDWTVGNAQTLVLDVYGAPEIPGSFISRSTTRR
jgi:hypothetical protein